MEEEINTKLNRLRHIVNEEVSHYKKEHFDKKGRLNDLKQM